MQMTGVLAEEMTRSRRYRCQISSLPRQIELACPDGTRISEGIREVSDRLSEAALKVCLAFTNLPHSGHAVAFCQDGMRNAVRAYADIGLACQILNLVPAKAAFSYQPARVDACQRGKSRCCGFQLVRQGGSQFLMENLEGVLLFKWRTSRESDESSPYRERHFVEPRNRVLKLQPPEPTVAVEEICRDENRPWRIVPSQHRPSVLDIVTVPIIEGQHGERAISRTRLQSFWDSVELYEFETLMQQLHESEFKEIRRNFENLVRRELARSLRPDVMQHQNQTAAPSE